LEPKGRHKRRATLNKTPDGLGVGMRTEIQEAKLALRQRIRGVLRSIDPAKRAAESLQACLLLNRQSVWQDASSILFYAPLLEELDIWPLVVDSLGMGKTVALPRFDPKTNRYSAACIQHLTRDIQPGHFGIREPADHCSSMELSSLDLTLIPGIAFDVHGGRLGRGKGFYDQLLVHTGGMTCGVAFDEQIVAEVPIEPHDRRVKCVLTPTRWVEC